MRRLELASPRVQRLIRVGAELRRDAASADGRRQIRKDLWSGTLGYFRTSLDKLWQTSRSNHTIINAIAPPEEDILGSTLQDEQVIHIFFSTFLVELWMTFMISDENEGDFNLLATMYVGLLCSLIGGACAKLQASTFTLGNKKRRYQTWLDRLPGKVQKWRKLRRKRLRQATKRRTMASSTSVSRTSETHQRKTTTDPNKTRLNRSPPPSPPAADRQVKHHQEAANTANDPQPPDKRAQWKQAGLVKHLKVFQKPKLTDQEKAQAEARAELKAKEAERQKRMTLIPFSRRYAIFRWTCGWFVNIMFYIILCAMDFIYGVQTGSVQFGQVMIAWGAALIFTYLVVEPAEILGIVFLPFIAENEYVVYCQDKAKYYGLY